MLCCIQILKKYCLILCQILHFFLHFGDALSHVFAVDLITTFVREQHLRLHHKGATVVQTQLCMRYCVQYHNNIACNILNISKCCASHYYFALFFFGIKYCRIIIIILQYFIILHFIFLVINANVVSNLVLQY